MKDQMRQSHAKQRLCDNPIGRKKSPDIEVIQDLIQNYDANTLLNIKDIFRELQKENLLNMLNEEMKRKHEKFFSAVLIDHIINKKIPNEPISLNGNWIINGIDILDIYKKIIEFKENSEEKNDSGRKKEQEEHQKFEDKEIKLTKNTVDKFLNMKKVIKTADDDNDNSFQGVCNIF